MLENKLEKAMINYNEALNIRKTYEIILRGLKEERQSYDMQLEGLEKAIRAKSNDFEELLLLSNDAQMARDLAERDLKDYEGTIAKPGDQEIRNLDRQK